LSLSIFRKFNLGRLFFGVLLILIAVPILVGCTGQNRNAATQSWSGVAVSNDTTYIGTKDGKLIQLSVEGGIARIAPFEAPQTKQNQGFPAIYGTPTINEDRIYFGTYNGLVVSLNRTDLRDMRSFEIGGNDLTKGIAGSVIVHENRLVVAAAEDANEGRLYVLDSQTLSEICRYPARNEDPIGQLWTTPIAANGVAYFGDLNHYVHSISIADCSTNWVSPTKLGGAVVSPPTILGNNLYLGTFDQYFYEIDLLTGSSKKLFAGENWFWAGSITDGNTFYIPNMDGNIYAYDVGTGRIRWVYPDEPQIDPILAAPVLYEDKLVYATDAGMMVVLDAVSGSRLWDRRVGDSVRSPLTSSENLVFLHSIDETITAIDMETRQLAWARNLEDVR
tara:strand:- start:5014 stop:6186 length:1173 start_codon:yes stop_codon:yes gene_type:complete